MIDHTEEEKFRLTIHTLILHALLLREKDLTYKQLLAMSKELTEMVVGDY